MGSIGKTIVTGTTVQEAATTSEEPKRKKGLPRKAENATIGQLKNASKAEIEKWKALGKLQSSRFNDDGTLAYATFRNTEEVGVSGVHYSEREARYDFENWLKSQKGGPKTFSSIDVHKDQNMIVAWRNNGDKYYFDITGGTQTVENYIEPNNRFGKKDSDKIYVQKRIKGTKLKFTYTGMKKY